MEDKKAKFLVYIVVALIAFVASSAVYSMTGGLSDWIGASDYDEDKNNNGYLDSSENGGGLFSLFDSNDNSDNYNNDGSDWSELIDKGMNAEGIGVAEVVGVAIEFLHDAFSYFAWKYDANVV